jgi:predicted amidohydrolase
MRVAGLQLDIAWEDKPANLAKARRLAEAAELPARSLLVLPEMFSSGFSMNVDRVAEAGEVSAALGAIAKDLGLFVLGGVVTKAADGRGRNQAAAFGPDGLELARYTKLHPFSFAGETDHYAPGTEVLRFDWDGVAVCPFVCYDLRFPEIFREGVRMGAQLYAVIANWPQPREEHWTTLLRARAIENQAYVVGVNRCGRDPKLTYSGRSLVVDPKGVVLADAGNAEGVFGAELDLAGLLEYRKQFPALGDMKRP